MLLTMRAAAPRMGSPGGSTLAAGSLGATDGAAAGAGAVGAAPSDPVLALAATACGAASRR